MSSLDKHVVLRRPDGSFITMTFISEGRQQGETDAQFIEREYNKLITERPSFAMFQRFDMMRADIKSAIDKTPQKSKRYLRCDATGKLSHDPTIKTPMDLRAERISSARIKLKVLGLTDSELDTVVGK